MATIETIQQQVLKYEGFIHSIVSLLACESDAIRGGVLNMLLMLTAFNVRPVIDQFI